MYIHNFKKQTLEAISNTSLEHSFAIDVRKKDLIEKTKKLKEQSTFNLNIILTKDKPNLLDFSEVIEILEQLKGTEDTLLIELEFDNYYPIKTHFNSNNRKIFFNIKYGNIPNLSKKGVYISNVYFFHIGQVGKNPITGKQSEKHCFAREVDGCFSLNIVQDFFGTDAILQTSSSLENHQTKKQKFAFLVGLTNKGLQVFTLAYDLNNILQVSNAVKVDIDKKYNVFEHGYILSFGKNIFASIVGKKLLSDSVSGLLISVFDKHLILLNKDILFERDDFYKKLQTIVKEDFKGEFIEGAEPRFEEHPKERVKFNTSKTVSIGKKYQEINLNIFFNDLKRKRHINFLLYKDGDTVFMKSLKNIHDTLEMELDFYLNEFEFDFQYEIHTDRKGKQFCFLEKNIDDSNGDLVFGKTFIFKNGEVYTYLKKYEYAIAGERFRNTFTIPAYVFGGEKYDDLNFNVVADFSDSEYLEEFKYRKDNPFSFLDEKKVSVYLDLFSASKGLIKRLPLNADYFNSIKKNSLIRFIFSIDKHYFILLSFHNRISLEDEFEGEFEYKSKARSYCALFHIDNESFHCVDEENMNNFIKENKVKFIDDFVNKMPGFVLPESLEYQDLFIKHSGNFLGLFSICKYFTQSTISRIYQHSMFPLGKDGNLMSEPYNIDKRAGRLRGGSPLIFDGNSYWSKILDLGLLTHKSNKYGTTFLHNAHNIIMSDYEEILVKKNLEIFNSKYFPKNLKIKTIKNLKLFDNGNLDLYCPYVLFAPCTKNKTQKNCDLLIREKRFDKHILTIFGKKL